MTWLHRPDVYPRLSTRSAPVGARSGLSFIYSFLFNGVDDVLYLTPQEANKTLGRDCTSRGPDTASQHPYLELSFSCKHPRQNSEASSGILRQGPDTNLRAALSLAPE